MTTNKKRNATTIRFDDDYTLQVIDKAAVLLNQTRTGFLLSAARERAETVIKKREQIQREVESIILSPRASLDIVQTLEKHPKSNKALRKAMQDYKDFINQRD
jgi:uncharacterized protein (DUF1778 family)